MADTEDTEKFITFFNKNHTDRYMEEANLYINKMRQEHGNEWADVLEHLFNLGTMSAIKMQLNTYRPARQEEPDAEVKTDGKF